jgi:phosphoribosylglycinamide formyltransferase-1
MAERPRFAILASGRGTNAEALMDLFGSGEVAADLVLVLSNVPDAPVLERAGLRGVPTAVVPHPGLDREEHEDLVLERLGDYRVDHLALAGYMRILSSHFLDRFPGPILNIHPSLLPEFPGLDAPARQWEAGVAEAGATVHLVTEEVDAGPILLQGRIDVRGDEGPEELARRILTEVEHRIYPEAIRLLVAEHRKEAP